MNERIRELALLAHSDALESYRERMKTEFAGDVIFSDMYDQKFAKLIVRECERVSLRSSHRDDDMGAIIARQIKQHFGVE
jgi:hypothetical protein